MNHVLHTLLEATIALYPADAADLPILTQPVWAGVAAENLVIDDQWIKHETRPTGRRFPRKHPLVPQYEISIDRVWALPISNLAGFHPERSRYVLDILWLDEDDGYWHRETYYGVTISRRSRASRDIEHEHQDKQVFDAEYYTVAVGQTAPPPIQATPPYTVRYVSETENILLYTHDNTTGAFTAVASTTDRATVGYVSNNLEITFPEYSHPVVKITATEFNATAFDVSAPDTAQLPRLEFFIGPTRVAVVSKAGRVYSPAFVQSDPPAGDSFHVYVSGLLRATIESSRIICQSFKAFSPSSVGGVDGLRLWVKASDLSGPDGTPFTQWLDVSGRRNDFLGNGTFRLQEGKPAVHFNLQNMQTVCWAYNHGPDPIDLYFEDVPITQVSGGEDPLTPAAVIQPGERVQVTPKDYAAVRVHDGGNFPSDTLDLTVEVPEGVMVGTIHIGEGGSGPAFETPVSTLLKTDNVLVFDVARPTWRVDNNWFIGTIADGDSIVAGDFRLLAVPFGGFADQTNLYLSYQDDTFSNEMSVGPLLEQWYLLEAEIQADVMYMRNNGSQSLVGLQSTAVPAVRPLFIGHNYLGYHREILVYAADSLTATDKSRVRAYLNDRHRIY